MRRVAAILLIASVAALGTGALEYVHNAAHALQDHAASEHGEHQHHDDTNCATHAQLNMPMLQAGYVPILICLGLLIAFLTLLNQPLVSLRLPARLDCRGPPVAC